MALAGDGGRYECVLQSGSERGIGGSTAKLKWHLPYRSPDCQEITLSPTASISAHLRTLLSSTGNKMVGFLAAVGGSNLNMTCWGVRTSNLGRKQIHEKHPWLSSRERPECPSHLTGWSEPHSEQFIRTSPSFLVCLSFKFNYVPYYHKGKTRCSENTKSNRACCV